MTTESLTLQEQVRQEMKWLRGYLKLTQDGLGRALDVSGNTIARWERGEIEIAHPRMLKLALLALKSIGEDAIEGRP